MNVYILGLEFLAGKQNNCFDVGHRLSESRQNLDCSICDLRYHPLLHRKELGVFDATSSSHVAKHGSDVRNCLAAIYVCKDSIKKVMWPILSGVLGRIRNLCLDNKGLNYSFGN